MGTILRVVNPHTYQFIQSIAARFDEIKFPGTSSPPLIPSKQDRVDGIKWEILQTYDGEKWKPCEKSKVLSSRKIRQEMVNLLPAEIVGQIGSHANNFSEWVVILGITDPQIHPSTNTLENSANALLSHLGIQRNQQSAHAQLLTVVFEEVFKSYSGPEQMELFQKMVNCSETMNRFSFKVRLAIFKIQLAAAQFFGNQVMRVALGLMVAWQSAKLYAIARAFYDRYIQTYYIPKAVNLLINYTPIQMIPKISMLVRVIQYVVTHQFRLMLLMIVASAVAGTYKPYVNKIKKVVLLPSYIFQSPFWIFIHAFQTSKAIQVMLADSSKQGSERIKRETVTENTPRAYQLWMYLMRHPDQLYQECLSS